MWFHFYCHFSPKMKSGHISQIKSLYFVIFLRGKMIISFFILFKVFIKTIIFVGPSTPPLLLPPPFSFFYVSPLHNNHLHHHQSPPPSPSISISTTGPQPTKKFVKSESFSPKPTNPSNANPTSGPNPKLNPSSPGLNDQVVKRSPVLSLISVKEAGKHFSYKEVALAAPGTIVKAIAENLPKDPSVVTVVETEKVPETVDIEKLDKEVVQAMLKSAVT
ncbi:hypothetical protein Hanom_Chr03g00278451 [Helianthus anomalus]